MELHKKKKKKKIWVACAKARSDSMVLLIIEPQSQHGGVYDQRRSAFEESKRRVGLSLGMESAHGSACGGF